jgi:hypothetical protein
MGMTAMQPGAQQAAAMMPAAMMPYGYDVQAAVNTMLMNAAAAGNLTLFKYNF